MTHVNRRRFLKAASSGVATLALVESKVCQREDKDTNPELAATFKLKDRGF